MEMVQRLSTENGKIVEKRHEMILAHEKFGVKIKNITKEYGISVGAYYYWSDRYARVGIRGLINKELDADDIWVIVTIQVQKRALTK